MIGFRTLKNTTAEELTKVFNLSFSDYFVPFNLTPEQLQSKMETKNIDLNYSAGVYSGNKLVGFILHAYERDGTARKMYNGATGVIPQYRGNNLTIQMYQFILPFLAKEADYITLEVLIQNIQAIKSYKSVGFKEINKLECFTGDAIISPSPNKNIVIERLQTYNWNELCTFWDIRPTWQNSISTVEKLHDKTASLGAYEDNLLIGYVIFNPASKRIHQLAVDKKHRNKGVAKELISRIVKNFGSNITAVNVNSRSAASTGFFKAIGLKNNLTQAELKCRLNENLNYET